MLSSEKERSETAVSISFERDRQRRAAILTARKILAEQKKLSSKMKYASNIPVQSIYWHQIYTYHYPLWKIYEQESKFVAEHISQHKILKSLREKKGK